MQLSSRQCPKSYKSQHKEFMGTALGDSLFSTNYAYGPCLGKGTRAHDDDLQPPVQILPMECPF